MVKVMVWMHLSTMLRLVAAGARLPAIDEMYRLFLRNEAPADAHLHLFLPASLS